MIYAVSQTETFERTAEKFFKKHKDLLPKFAELTEKLSENPFEKSLKTHKLKGELSSYYACSLTYDYRVIVTIVIKDKVITLLGVFLRSAPMCSKTLPIRHCLSPPPHREQKSALILETLGLPDLLQHRSQNLLHHPPSNLLAS